MKLQLDGKTYHVSIDQIQRESEIRDGKNAGNALSGTRLRDVLGTFVSYTVSIPTSRLSAAEYDALYEVLSAPQNEPHTVTLPYAQRMETFPVYITKIKDTAAAVGTDGSETVWTGLSVTFSPERARRFPV